MEESGRHLQPHRGVLILVFGILAFAVCFIFGICAWVMGNTDLRAMDAGQMDPEGRGMTQAGKVVGMIAAIINLAVFAILFFILVVGAGVSVTNQ